MSPRLGYRVAAIALAIVAAIGVHVVWYLFVNTPTGQAIDRAAFEGALILRNQLWQVGRPVLEVVSNTLVVGSALAAVIIAVLRHRLWLAIQALLVIVGANVTTQLIKGWYDRPDLLSGWTGQNSLPSGHTTVVAAASIAMLLTVPRRWRWMVAVVGAVWTLLTGISTLIGRWHRPADVVAALLVACFWGAIACLFGSGRSQDPLAASKYRSTTMMVTSVLAGFGGISAAVALGALVRLYRIIAASDTNLSFADRLAGGELTAYIGGIGAVLASVFGVFGVLLWLRDKTLNTAARTLQADNSAELGYGARVVLPTPVAIPAVTPQRIVVNQEEMWREN